jgi:membrane protein implicated in regulation of membrane protease activity
MVLLSFLIVAALVVAVASFLFAGAQWLLVISAALVVAAFYLSRRATPPATSDADPQAQPTVNTRARLRVSIDSWTLPRSGRHRVEGDADQFSAAASGGPDTPGFPPVGVPAERS